MKESTTYQYILDEGRIEQAQNDILLVGPTCFGTPRKEVQTTLKEITDLERMKRMMARVVKAASWEDLLETR
jgi:hypothetical protein